MSKTIMQDPRFRYKMTAVHCDDLRESSAAFPRDGIWAWVEGGPHPNQFDFGAKVTLSPLRQGNFEKSMDWIEGRTGVGNNTL